MGSWVGIREGFVEEVMFRLKPDQWVDTSTKGKETFTAEGRADSMLWPRGRAGQHHRPAQGEKGGHQIGRRGQRAEWRVLSVTVAGGSAIWTSWWWRELGEQRERSVGGVFSARVCYWLDMWRWKKGEVDIFSLGSC